MTTIATSLERCTLITMHERAPQTDPQADPHTAAVRPVCDTIADTDRRRAGSSRRGRRPFRYRRCVAAEGGLEPARCSEM